MKKVIVKNAVENVLKENKEDIWAGRYQTNLGYTYSKFGVINRIQEILEYELGLDANVFFTSEGYTSPSWSMKIPIGKSYMFVDFTMPTHWTELMKEAEELGKRK